MYKDMMGFITTLTDNLSKKQRSLPIHEDKYEELLDYLDDGDYTFMRIQQGRAIEYVKVTNVCDKLVLDRGAEETTPLWFACGSSIEFALTKTGIERTICQMETCE